MLKKFLLALVALCLVMVAGGVRAEVNSRVFAKAGGDGWPALETQLKKDGMLTGEVIQTNALEAIAYGVAKSRNFIPKNVNDDEVFPQFVNAFRGLNGIGDTITVAEFRALATGNGIYLPEYTGEVSTAEQTEKVVIDQSPTLQFVAASAQTDRLEREVAELRKQLAQARIDVRNGDAQVATLAEKRLKELDKQLTGITGQLEKLPGTAEVEKLSNEVASVSALLTEIPGLKQAQAEQAMEYGTLRKWVVGIGVFGALAILVALIGNLRVSKTRAIAEVAKTEATEAKTFALALQNDVAELGSRVGAVERDVYKILFNKEAVEESTVDAMRIGAVCELDIRSEESGEVFTTLRIVRTQTGVDIHGIKRARDHRDNFTSYPVADLASAIRRAFKQGRMSGVSTPSTARLVAVS